MCHRRLGAQSVDSVVVMHGATSALAVDQAVAIRVTITGAQLTPFTAMRRVACSVSAGGQMP